MSRLKKGDVGTVLNSISGFEGRVRYYAFPEGEAPGLPFITYIFPDEDGFGADNQNYLPTVSVQVELYTKLKDPASEALVEAALTAQNVFFTKDSTYLDDEQAYMTVFNFEVT